MSIFWQETTVPDGVYKGRQGGYEVEILVNDKRVKFHTQHGIRGINIPVTVTIKDGHAIRVVAAR